MGKCMIVYASCTGVTRECAEALAQKIGECELFDLDYGIPYVVGYDTVILGSYVHMGNVARNAKRFLVQNLRELSKVRVGIYICNIAIEQADEILQANFPLGLLEHAVCITTLGGELRFDELRGLDRMVAKKMERTMAQNGVEPPHVLTHILEEFAKRMKAENR